MSRPEAPFVRLRGEAAGPLGCREASFVALILWWQGKGKDPDGWIYKTREEIHAAIGLTRREQDTVRRRLRALKLLKEVHKGYPRRPWYRIDVEVLVKRIPAAADWPEVRRHRTVRKRPPDAPPDGTKAPVRARGRTGGKRPKDGRKAPTLTGGKRPSIPISTEENTVENSLSRSRGERDGDPREEQEPDDVERLCALLADLVARNRAEVNGGSRPKITARWRADVGELLARDIPAGVEGAIRHSQTDPFWRARVDSMALVRKHYGKLRQQATEAGLVHTEPSPPREVPEPLPPEELTPPWIREGITRQEWTRRQKHGGSRWLI